MTGVVPVGVVALGSAALLCAAEPLGAQFSSARQHQFDFVVGNWLVRDSAGRATGTVSVSPEYGGCVLIERWHGAAKSGEGLGVIGYQPARGTWHRDYLDPTGIASAFDGRVDGATMTMTGTDYQSEAVRLNRVTWKRQGDGSIEERWQVSTDGGRTWRGRSFAVLRRIAE